MPNNDRYNDNLVSEYYIPGWEQALLDRIPKANIMEHLPITVYDMVQCGYPLADHGEMIPRFYGDRDEDGNMLPPKGMWCKADEVLDYLRNMHKQETETDA